MLYRWQQKYTADGDKTRFATLEEENKALRLKNVEQATEIDMLERKFLLDPQKGAGASLGRMRTRKETAQGVFAFIHSFYNTQRIQKCLGYLSPLE